MKRQAPIRGEVVPLSKLRGGQTKKRSQEAVRLSQKAARHEMLADIADQDGEANRVRRSGYAEDQESREIVPLI